MNDFHKLLVLCNHKKTLLDFVTFFLHYKLGSIKQT